MSTTVMDTTVARRVVWPFNRTKGWSGRTIGDLLEASLITERDLRWAASVTRKPEVKQACEALLAVVAKTASIKPDVDQSITPPVVKAAAPSVPSPVIEKRQAVAIAPEKKPVVAIPSIPATCPVCGTATQHDTRFDSRKHGAAWRCEQAGLLHYLTAVRLPALKAVFSPDFVVIPATDGCPEICRRDLTGGEYGYLPAANQPVVIPPGTLTMLTPDSGPRHWATEPRKHDGV